MEYPFGRGANLNNEFGLKGNITDEDHMINILNNLPEDYSVIVDGLENHLMAARDNVLTMNMICKKLNHRYKKRKRIHVVFNPSAHTNATSPLKKLKELPFW